jgi:hypothetical protein
VLEVAEIIRRHGAAVRAHLGSRLLPSQTRALRDLVACRTAASGGQLTQCTACGKQVYRYHSCRNRHCPKCGGDQTARWLERHRARLLPCRHYLITVTLPSAVRAVAFHHQAVVDGALMRCAAAALQALAADPRFVGASLGCIAVLHTWTRVLDYLARYLFRVAISNSRLEQIDDDQVTFRYRDNRTQTIRRVTLSGVDFLRRFLRHVLPRRCMKVRYYGLWSATRRSDLDHARTLLEAERAPATPAGPPVTNTPTVAAPHTQPVCPLCHVGTLTVLALLRPRRKMPP